MHRRHYLAVTATMTAGIAGCTGSLGGSNDSPEGVVERFYTAIDDGDRETANALIHSDSPVGEISEEDMSNYENRDITIERTELLEESDDVAEVRIEVTMETDGNSRTSESTHELRTEDGEWKLYE
jgi:ketosteroid isomerase-like protein